jgi:diamine N-acetyltransferase
MIAGKRVRFRAVERNDISNFVEWLNDPEVTQGLSIYLPLSMAQEEKWFEDMLNCPKDEQPLIIEVLQGNGWRPVGNCNFHNLDYRNRCAEAGIFIGEKGVWNQGFGTEAMLLLLKHGFETLNLNRIALDVHSTNLRAIRSYEKAGFTLEGCKRQAIYKNGKYVDILIMSVLKSEWESRQAME